MSFVGSFLFCCLNRPRISDIEGHIDKEDGDVDVHCKKSSYTAKVLQNTQVYNDASGFKELERTWKYILSPKMLSMMPAILWTSVSFSMIKGIFPSMIERALENSFEEYPKAKDNEDL